MFEIYQCHQNEPQNIVNRDRSFMQIIFDFFRNFFGLNNRDNNILENLALNHLQRENLQVENLIKNQKVEEDIIIKFMKSNKLDYIEFDVVCPVSIECYKRYNVPVDRNRIRMSIRDDSLSFDIVEKFNEVFTERINAVLNGRFGDYDQKRHFRYISSLIGNGTLAEKSPCKHGIKINMSNDDIHNIAENCIIPSNYFNQLDNLMEINKSNKIQRDYSYVVFMGNISYTNDPIYVRYIINTCDLNECSNELVLHREVEFADLNIVNTIGSFCRDRMKNRTTERV
jgi:hypothetical protein